MIALHKQNNNLKELYTSETTLAQKIVLNPLNNEFNHAKRLKTDFLLEFLAY